MKPAAADTGPTVTSSVAVCAENLLTNGPVSARGLTGRWTTPVMGTLLPATPGVVAAANPAAAGRSSGRLFGVRTGSGAGIDEPHRPSPAWLGRVVPTGGDRVAVLVDVGPFDSPIVFMMASRFDEMSQQVFRARVELQHHDYFAATAQEDLLTVGVLLTPGTSSGRAWDTTMVAAKGDQELDPEYVVFIRTQLDDSLRYP